MKHIVVVGGGIAGILSALLLSSRRCKVTLIEKDEEIGGLLRSYTDDGEHWFDYGTHFLMETGNKQIDKLLFDVVDSRRWNVFECPRAGCFFKSLNQDNSFIDARKLPRKDYLEGLEQALNATDADVEVTNLRQQLEAMYGKLYTRKLFDPVLKKFFGKTSVGLNANSHKIIGLGRIAALTEDAARAIKMAPLYDDKFGFHSYREGLNKLRTFYPKKNGMGAWVKQMANKLQSKGVRIITGAHVADVNKRGKKITSLALGDGEVLACDHVIWTVPAFLLAGPAGLKLPTAKAPPERLFTTIHNFIIDKPYLTDLHYIYCFDPSVSIFRVTQYGNYSKRASTMAISAEVLSKRPGDMTSSRRKVFSELKKMKVIPSDASATHQFSKLVPGGFPVPTPEFSKRADAQNKLVRDSFNNVSLLGKGTGEAFFMNDVFASVHRQIGELKL